MSIERRVSRLESIAERDCGGADGVIYYITASRGMSSEQALARLGIALGQHDRVALSTEPARAPN